MTTSYQSCNCLIVDQDAFMRRMLREMLRYHGIGHIDEAKDGAQALFLMEKFPVQLIITEFNLPVMSGLQLAAKIRRQQIPFNFAVPIIGFTETITHQIVAQARDSGFNEIMTKPFTSGALHKKLDMALGLQRPFIRTEGYVGPCRRRKSTTYAGPLRRQADQEAAAMSQPPSPPPAEPPKPNAMSQDALAKRVKREP